jgi:hypothetical protein
LPTIRSRAPSANRVSVVAGVSETIFSGCFAIVTLVPSSSVRVSGNATAAADGLAGSDGTGVPVAAGAIELVAPAGIEGAGVVPAEQAVRTRAMSATISARCGRDRWALGSESTGVSRRGRTGARGPGNREPLASVVEGGVSAGRSHRACPFRRR